MLSDKLSDMAPQSTLLILDKAHDGDLVKAIQRWRTDGRSVTEIVVKLNAEFNIDAVERTVYRWLDQIDGRAS